MNNTNPKEFINGTINELRPLLDKYNLTAKGLLDGIELYLESPSPKLYSALFAAEHGCNAMLMDKYRLSDKDEAEKSLAAIRLFVYFDLFAVNGNFESNINNINEDLYMEVIKQMIKVRNITAKSAV